MKKALFIFSVMALGVSSFAQGTLIFKTLGIQNAAGTGTYNVPIFVNVVGAGVGMQPGGATLGLFAPGSITPFATSLFGTTAATSPFIVTPASQTVAVPGSAPGTTPTITIRAWQGTDFAMAKSLGLSWGEWTLTTKPLGGDPGGGALPITPPTLTGWGPENGTGFILSPEPSTIALGLLGLGVFVLRRVRR